jgi:predicted dehydrogenase
MDATPHSLYIGFVGGGFNTEFHIRSLVQVRSCYVAGVTSGSHESALRCVELAKKLRLGSPRVYKTVDEMAASEQVNAIWICCPNYLRIEVMEAIVRGNETRKQKLLGVACEKPLARNVAEAKRLVQLANQSNLRTGYLENQVFAPCLVKGKEIVWSRAVPLTGRPYLCRAAEEHSGPHRAWFWQGNLQGGGVLNDMMCHSVEAARFLLTAPNAPRTSLIPIKVNAQIASLKWGQPQYADELKQTMGSQLDYRNHPAEDYAHATVTFKDQHGQQVMGTHPVVFHSIVTSL